METSTLDDGANILNNPLEMQIREVYGRTVYSHKTHEKCAEQLLSCHTAVNNILAVASAMAAGSLLLAVFGDSRPATIIGALLSTFQLGLSTYMKDKDFGKVAQQHVETANRLREIREKYLSLLTDIAGHLVNANEVKVRRDQLQEALDKIHNNAPRTSSNAYKAAQQALKHNEELTFSPEEIDAFLPDPLKRSAKR